ncbi:hypothetical protein FHW67_000024 [Herbaspirillum sp. Sphag1AN]|uniref:hypothetical protein n=1 Tax=unclassified Herbaspirillum TaxID=2624150 RepID=UPI001607C6E8|nr:MULTISPECIES: hypothetical protein [unclassified Herbaspirillum]MBB3210789.1 hypothetical protein [Herbaspirillum sp. Sphag1AN]MBB3244419.1 hypothetical protein [Herbaspirillum sp. Sphag64]
MNHLDILLPFSLPQAEMAAELIRQTKAPALATLLARGKSVNGDGGTGFDPFSRALPHEHWLGEQLGLSVTNISAPRGNSPAVAAPLLRRHQPTLNEGHWFVVQPAHIHVARDHLVLTDIEQLALQENEARLLFQSALPLFEEAGRTLLYLDAQTWLMRADDWANLQTSSPLAASGRNIDIWMPAGEGELAWRKLQNEVQMQWFADSLNDAREMRGQKAVNSLWLWGGGAIAVAQDKHNTASAYSASFNLTGWADAASAVNQIGVHPEQLLLHSGERALLLLDGLQQAAMSDDWGRWLQQLEALDRDWFVPLLQALRGKQLQSLSLMLSGQERLLQVTSTAGSLRKFWIRPGLGRLATDHSNATHASHSKASQ